MCVRLNLMQFEGRETPAVFQVSVADPDGQLGSTDATHDGHLELTHDLDQGNGFVYVKDATSAADAVRQAVVGSVRVTLGADSWAYEAGPDTIGLDPAEHKPFLLEVGPQTGYKVALRFEDMAGRAGCDYDYNDREWMTFSVAGDPDDRGLIDSESVRLNPNDRVETGTVYWSVRWPAGYSDRYLWRYDLLDENMPSDGRAPGVGGFAVLTGNTGAGRPAGAGRRPGRGAATGGPAGAGGATGRRPRPAGRTGRGPARAVSRTPAAGPVPVGSLVAVRSDRLRL